MKLLLAFAAASIFPAATSLTNSLDTDAYQEVYDLFDGKIEEMASSFENEYQTSWNPTMITDITDIYNEDEEHLGYLVVFDEGYLAYSNELSVLDVSNEGYPHYYKKTYNTIDEKLVYKCGAFNGTPTSLTESVSDNGADNIYYQLKNYYLADGFKINSSMVQIPYFKDVYDSSSWGNYQGITFSYAAPNSGAILCAMSLMYTLKVNGGADLTPYQKSYYTFMKNLEFYTDFDYTSNNTSFINSTVLYHGINEYLNDYFYGQYSFGSSALVNTTPAVTLYFNANSVKTAEYCMRVGHAQQPSWWVFNDYFDIVMADENNFYINEFGQPDFWIDNDLTPFYVVNQNYRDFMFQYYEDGKLLT